MKVVILFFSIILLGCVSSKKAGNYIANTDIVTITRLDSLSGQKIIKQSDCVTCHGTIRKLIGPSFSQLAGKYEADINTINKLALKIISGGPGSWGRIPMTPHPTLSKEEAEFAVKYILSLKK
ncbi:MAG: c-type cytochrome [Bacteroidota bacterium]